MPKGYWITRVDVYDAEQFEKYKAATVELFARHEASFLIRGGEQTLVEGTARGRNVVIEFPSYHAAPDAGVQRSIRRSQRYVGCFRLPTSSSSKESDTVCSNTENGSGENAQ